MKEYVWFFPIIFMFHDMEEIIGFKFFLRKKAVFLLFFAVIKIFQQKAFPLQFTKNLFYVF